MSQVLPKMYRFNKNWSRLLFLFYSKYMPLIFIKMLLCINHTASVSCKNGTIRLVNGSTSNEGRVEQCFNGDWVPYCGISSITASLICKQLGYNYTCKNNRKRMLLIIIIIRLIDASVFNDERFGRSNKSSIFSHKYCRISFNSLAQCTDVIKESSCYITPSHCPNEYGLRCYSNSLIN